MLNRFEVSVAREEVDGVDTLRYSFEKLLSQAVSKSGVVAITVRVVLLQYLPFQVQYIRETKRLD